MLKRLMLSLLIRKRNNLHRCAAHFTQKAIDHRAMKQYIPSRARRLPEYNVCDALAQRELDQRVGNAPCPQLHYVRPEFLGKVDVFDQGSVICRTNAVWLLARRLNVNRVPVRRQSSRDARACSKQLLRAAA